MWCVIWREGIETKDVFGPFVTRDEADEYVINADWFTGAEMVLVTEMTQPPVEENGVGVVLDIRLTALADAIRSRSWEDVEREYDRVRSTVAKMLGVRERETDRMQTEAS